MVLQLNYVGINKTVFISDLPHGHFTVFISDCLKVVERLLSLPVEYWRQFVVEQDRVLLGNTDGNHGFHTPEQKGTHSPTVFAETMMYTLGSPTLKLSYN